MILFLGVIAYYRRLISNFVKIAKLLTRLLKKDVIFCWSETQDQAFQKFKIILESDKKLKYPDFSKEFTLITDHLTKP